VPASKPETSEPKAKAKGKAKAEAKTEVKAEPKVEPKAKAKAEAKAKAKAEAKAEPKAKAKSQSKSEPQPAEAKTEAPKAAAKPAAKSKQSAKKAAPKVEEEEAPKKREPSPDRFLQFDDGSGEAWETSTGLSKKNQKRKERIEQNKIEEKAREKATGIKADSVGAAQHIPGMTVSAEKAANTASKTSTSQAVTATAVASVAAVAEKEAGPVKEVKILHSATVKIPDRVGRDGKKTSMIGVLIGPGGSMIKLIQEKTGAKLDTSSSDVCTIQGSSDEVAAAEIAVKELLEKGYTSLQYEDFHEHFVAVHPSAFPDIIGKQGCVIQKIKEELNVAVTIPPNAPKDAKPEKKYKVILAGKNADVERAKEVINNIVMYYHDPITHPDQVHEEFEVPTFYNALASLIGAKGSELRHIQNNYKVRMYIPRATSVNQKVVIVGTQHDVDRAKAYVDKLWWNAEHSTKGRDRQDQADDGWGGDEPMEDWMKDYIYKRN